MSPQSRIRERSLSDLGNNFRHAACLLVPEVADGAGEGVPLEVDDHPDQIRPIGVALGHSLEFGDKVIKDLGHRSGSELHAAPPGDVVLIRTRRPDRKYPMFPGVERIVVNRITMPCCGQKPFRQFGEVSAAALVNRDRGVPLPRAIVGYQLAGPHNCRARARRSAERWRAGRGARICGKRRRAPRPDQDVGQRRGGGRADEHADTNRGHFYTACDGLRRLSVNISLDPCRDRASRENTCTLRMRRQVASTVRLLPLATWRRWAIRMLEVACQASATG